MKTESGELIKISEASTHWGWKLHSIEYGNPFDFEEKWWEVIMVHEDGRKVSALEGTITLALESANDAISRGSWE